jgi:hypothetical protein
MLYIKINIHIFLAGLAELCFKDEESCDAYFVRLIVKKSNCGPHAARVARVEQP